MEKAVTSLCGRYERYEETHWSFRAIRDLGVCAASPDSFYTEGYIDKPTFTARMERSRERLARLTTEAQSLREQVHSQAELQRLISGLEGFSCQVAEQLE